MGTEVGKSMEMKKTFSLVIRKNDLTVFCALLLKAISRQFIHLLFLAFATFAFHAFFSTFGHLEEGREYI